MKRKPLSWNIRQVASMVKKKSLVFDNPIQRPAGQWKKEDASLLIDSVIRMFLPDIYAIQTQNDEGKNIYDVIDGKQRITLLTGYLNDEWALTQLEPVTLESTGEIFDISGKKFSELPEDVQNEINGYTLTFKVIELEDEDDEESVIDQIFIRLNNGKPMSRSHLAFVSASKNVQNFVHDAIVNNPLFTTTAHFPEGGIKNSDREITILQSIILAGGYEFSTFANKDVEKLFAETEISEDVLIKVRAAYEMICESFPEHNKFVNKTSIPALVALIVKNNFNKTLIEFMRDYAKVTKKGDSYRKYTGASSTKKVNVEGKVNGLQVLFEAWKTSYTEQEQEPSVGDSEQSDNVNNGEVNDNDENSNENSNEESKPQLHIVH